MRALILVLLLLMAPLAARAQTATPAAGPADEATGTYRVVAIAAGAVAGVIVANAVTGGLATPVLVMGAGEAILVPGSGFYVSAATTAIGAVAGGYLGNWLYGH
jgi:hypothetical protein